MMRIDSAGIPLPDDPPEPLDMRWLCPLCGAATWPHTTPDGKAAPTLCVPCRIAHDLQET